MNKTHDIAPEHTAVRTALWRALHVHIDPAPHVFNDVIGEKIIGEENWRNRPDMNADFSKSMRASITGRARFIEDLVEEQAKQGINQYIILGSGLDTFAQRRLDLLSHLHVFEVDQPGAQAWKQKRLAELGYNISPNLHFVPVDFEAGESWWDQLISSGFDVNKPAVIASTGVSMYLTKEANMATLSQVSKLASGSTFAMTFMLTLDLLEPKESAIMEFVMNKAKESGTPFLSLFSPAEIIKMAQETGFKKVKDVPANAIYQKYFAGRSDGLNAGNAEAFLVANT